MATALIVRVNYVDADVNYQTTSADYIALDLANDYFIWTEGDGTVKDLMTAEPNASQLNAAATQIDASSVVEVNLCLLMDYSADVGGAYYTHTIIGMNENKRYVFAFSFNGATASEPQLEGWDNSNHDSTTNHVLGNGTPANSFIKAICTTNSLPGVSWAGSALAGAANVLLLNDGNGALAVLGSGITSQELYANIKIRIPAAYSTPATEVFVFTTRYTWS
ncbi:hypothetical protein LCGC14_2177590 [marine sediment metagenome]|uniref:Uncharacterized protein n=1 Tax=marine sediment metagenome TaxID=412755 RepID=A0A0F9DN87_9ZZZZ